MNRPHDTAGLMKIPKHRRIGIVGVFKSVAQSSAEDHLVHGPHGCTSEIGTSAFRLLPSAFCGYMDHTGALQELEQECPARAWPATHFERPKDFHHAIESASTA